MQPDATGRVTHRWPLIGRTGILSQLQALRNEPGVTGAVIRGEGGSGKSRLLSELVLAFAKHDIEADIVIATRSAAAIPFGPFARLLPRFVSRQTDPLQRLQLAHETFAALARANAGGYVLCVDDAHLADEHSAALIHQLATTPPLFTVVTITGGHDAPDAVAALVRESKVKSLDLPPLSREAVGKLVEAVLGDTVADEAIAELWKLSEGNPFFLRELVIGAVQEKSLSPAHGEWRVIAPLATGARLIEVVEARLERLTAEARSALEVLTVGEPLDARVFSEFVSPDMEQSLARHRLIRISNNPGGRHVFVKHPLHAEVIEAELSPSHLDDIKRRLVKAFSDQATLDPMDVLRLARWQMEIGEIVNTEEVTAGARHALANDPGLAERLAHASFMAGGGFEAQLVLGESLMTRRKLEDAEMVLEDAWSTALTEEEMTRAAIALLRNHAHGLTDSSQAMETARQLFGTLRDPVCKDMLAAELAWLSLRRGDAVAAVDWGNLVSVGAKADRAAALRKELVTGEAQRRLGRLAAADEVIAAGLDAAAQTSDQPLARDRLLFTRLESTLYAGRVMEGERLARREYLRAQNEYHVANAGMWAAHLAWALLFRGNVKESVAMYDAAAESLNIVDPVGDRSLILCWRAVALTQAGDSGAVRKSLDLVSVAELENVFEAALAALRARAGLQALDGNIEAAGHAALESGLTAMDHSDLTYATLCLHDAVRFGRPELVVDQLSELSQSVEGGLTPLLAEHARVAAAGDATGLDRVSRNLGEMGLMLLAAEAASQAAMVNAEKKREGHAARAAARARLLAEQCPGAATPALLVRPVILTPREFEVASFASTGRTSRQIAQELSLSVRTVDNHLSAVYTKLHVRGRRELAEVLALPATQGNPSS